MNYLDEVKNDIKFEITKIQSIYEDIEELLQLNNNERMKKTFLEMNEDDWWELVKLYTRLQVLINTIEKVQI